MFISVDTNVGDGVALADKNRFLEFVKTRAPIGLEPVIIDPEFLYIEVVINATYNTNVTTMLPSAIDTLLRSAVSSYNSTYLNGFKKTIRYSKLIESLDNVDSSILGVQLDLHPFKTFTPTSGTKFTKTIDFGYELSTQFVVSQDDAIYQSIPAVRSSNLIKNDRNVYLMDDLNGTLGLYTTINGASVKLENVGTVDYITGRVVITDLLIDTFTPASGTHAHLYAQPKSVDITVSKNTILKIRDSDIEVSVTATKE